MYTIFKNIHHYTAMAVLVFILLFTVVSFIYYIQRRPVSAQIRKISVITIIFTHTQLLLGIVLFLSSPVLHNVGMKDIMTIGTLRRNYVEHPFTMVIVAGLLTFANYHLKKLPRITIWILAVSAISLALVIGMIPKAFWGSIIL
ncbi:MAG: hypothetical protein LBP34_04640 [Flavobacteriaceae bacterium]|jgi:hypothetical protein|nr:hypothetical protein [Flavobacteriaceae bacterium]